MALLFDWDEDNKSKCEKRVPIADIEAVFANPKTRKGSARQEGGEQRWWAIDPDRKIFLIFAHRRIKVFAHRKIKTVLHIRVISARYMHDKELEALWRRRR